MQCLTVTLDDACYLIPSIQTFCSNFVVVFSYLIHSILTKSFTKVPRLDFLKYHFHMFTVSCSFHASLTEATLWTIVVHQIIITTLGPMSGPESVAVGRETKRALDVWQCRGKLGFVANGWKANCSEWKRNVIGREIKWSFSHQMAKWGQMSCRSSALNHMRTIAPAAPFHEAQYDY